MDLTFENIADVLLGAGITESPSELHGMLSGRLTGGQQLTDSDCLNAVAEMFQADAEKLGAISDTLITLCRATAGQLEDTSFGFELLLPDDEYELTQRLDCLGEWCQGFLVGLGLSGLSSDTRFSADAADALKDLAQIAQIDPQEMDSDEGDNQFFEVSEYVRMAVLLVHSEVLEAQLPDGEKKPTIH